MVVVVSFRGMNNDASGYQVEGHALPSWLTLWLQLPPSPQPYADALPHSDSTLGLATFINLYSPSKPWYSSYLFSQPLSLSLAPVSVWDPRANSHTPACGFALVSISLASMVVGVVAMMWVWGVVLAVTSDTL